MAADQEAAQGSPEGAAKGAGTPGTKGAATGAGTPGTKGAAKDAKARFREALERKRATASREGEARRNNGSVHGSEVAGSTRRTYRRKTG